jgi:hypothetical protein
MLSHSSEATSCAATQELLSILCNLKVHYDIDKSPLSVRILYEKNLVHTAPLYLSKINFNIIRPPISWFS